MKIKYLVLVFILLSQSLLAWGNTGHRIVGEIAETYLTKNAKMQIKKLIGHHDLSRISNWGDEIKQILNGIMPGNGIIVQFPMGKNMSRGSIGARPLRK